MKVFLSWSGKKSKIYAEVFNEFIAIIIPGIETFMSAEEIDKGMRWSEKIATELQNTDFGILFVTNDNIGSPWLNFEAGALSKFIDIGRVAPLLIDAKIENISGTPISQFQASLFDKEEIRRLLVSIAKLNSSTKVDIVNQYFEKFWPDIEEKLSGNLANNADLVQGPEPSPMEKTLNEMFNLLKRQNFLLSNPERILPGAHVGKAIALYGDVPAQMKKMAHYIEETDKMLDKVKDQFLFKMDDDDLEELQNITESVEDLVRDHELFEDRGK